EGTEGRGQGREEGEEDRGPRGARAGAGVPDSDRDTLREEGRTHHLVRTLRPQSRRDGRRPPKASSRVHREGGGQESRTRGSKTRASENGKEAQRETEGEGEASMSGNRKSAATSGTAGTFRRSDIAGPAPFVGSIRAASKKSSCTTNTSSKVLMQRSRRCGSGTRSAPESAR